MNTPAIAVSNLSKRYDDVVALDDASFEVPLGTICGFVGPNGSGKTTTIRMLLGLIKPSSGTGTIIGNSISHPEKYLKDVGAMIEGPAFYPALSGLENLKVFAKLGGIQFERCQDLLELVGLGDRGRDKYKNYSLGMKQRLGIAAALLPNPKLLILDEPTSHLDIGHQIALLNSLTELSKESNCAVVASLHDIGLIGRGFTHALLFTSTGGDEGSYISGAVNDVVNPANLEKALGHPVQRVIAADGRQVFIPA